MRNLRNLAAVLAALLGSASAQAALPDIVDTVPGDARAVVVLRSVNELDESIGQLLIAMEQGEASTPKQLLKIFGIAGAVDPRRPVAAFWRAGESPMLAALVPTLNAEKAMDSLRATKGQEGVWSFESGGRTWYARALSAQDLIIGIEPRSIAAYQPMTGQMAAHERAIGAMGMRAADGAHAAAWGQAEELRPLLGSWMDRLEAGAGALDAGGAKIPGVEAVGAFARALGDGVVRDAERFVIAARFDSSGVVADFVTRFGEGSEMDRLSRADRVEAEAGAFDGLPALPFLLAASVDASHEGVRALASQAVGGDSPTALSTADAIALAAYEPQGPLVMEGGLSKVLVHWRAEEPGMLADWFGRYIRLMDGAQGATVSYDEQTGELGGVVVDRWLIAMPGSGARSTQMLYGQHGSPRGVVAVREDDGYISAAPDDLITNVLRGRAAGNLTGNAMIRDLSARLPEKPVAQFYLNFRPMVMQAVPVLAMAGVNIDVPLRVAPIAGAVSMEQGEARMGVFVPAYGLKLGWQGWNAYRAVSGQAPTQPGPQPARGR